MGRVLLGLVAVLCWAACDDGTAPQIGLTSLSPGPNAVNVETNAVVTVVFDRAIDPATLNAETFQVKRGGALLATFVSYDSATRTVRVRAPLLPNNDYEIEITPDVRTLLGAGLSEPRSWRFATRAWQPLSVDSAGSVGRHTSQALDPSGRFHLSYFDETNSDLKYATCAAGCSVQANWRAVTVDSAGTVGLYTSLAVDGSGRLHIGYQDQGARHDLKYATCASACDSVANWQVVTVDSAGIVGLFTSLAVDGDGRVHIAYFHHTSFNLKYATCATDCTAIVRPVSVGGKIAAGWRILTVDEAGDVGTVPSLAVGANGRLHVSYFDITNGSLKYATCAVGCDAAASWEKVIVDAAGVTGSYSSLATDETGRVHAAYHHFTNNDLLYATCALNCQSIVSWQQGVIVDGVGSVGHDPSLAVDAGGRIHVSYRDFANEDLKYATCVVGCDVATGWQAVTVDAAGMVGLDNSLVVDGNGRPHISYLDFTRGDLRIID